MPSNEHLCLRPRLEKSGYRNMTLFANVKMRTTSISAFAMFINT